MSKDNRIYRVPGFRILLSPNSWRRSDVYFRVVGHSIQLVHIEVFDDEGMFLGTIMRQNFTLETLKAMRTFVTTHKNQWHQMPPNFLA